MYLLMGLLGLPGLIGYQLVGEVALLVTALEQFNLSSEENHLHLFHIKGKTDTVVVITRENTSRTASVLKERTKVVGRPRDVRLGLNT